MQDKANIDDIKSYISHHIDGKEIIKIENDINAQLNHIIRLFNKFKLNHNNLGHKEYKKIVHEIEDFLATSLTKLIQNYESTNMTKDDLLVKANKFMTIWDSLNEIKR